jgi:Domain of unknown function (DUF4349)
MRARWLIAGLLAGALGCVNNAPKATKGQSKDAAVGRTEEATLGNRAPSSPLEARDESSERETHSPAATAAVDRAAAPSMIVRTGNASIEVDSLEPAIDEVRRLAQRLGGYIANTAVQAGREQLRQATLEIKTPADRFEDLTGGLRPVGKIEFINVTAEDVGEEFVDLTARAANGRRLEERLLDLLGNRTGRLKDVLEVERELSRVREEIERLDGRLRYLRTRVAMSSLSVTVHEPPPLVSHPGGSPIVDAFRQAWRNFVGLLAGFIESLGIVVPVAGVAWGAVLLIKRMKR